MPSESRYWFPDYYWNNLKDSIKDSNESSSHDLFVLHALPSSAVSSKDFHSTCLRIAATLSCWGDLKPGDKIAVFVCPEAAESFVGLAALVHGMMLASLVPCLIDIQSFIGLNMDSKNGSMDDAKGSLDASKDSANNHINRPNNVDLSSQLLQTLRSLSPRLLVATPSLLFDRAQPILKIADALREINMEWERVLVFDPPPGQDKSAEGFVAVGDLAWMGKGILERGVKVETYRRVDGPGLDAGVVEPRMTKQESETMPAIIHASLAPERMQQFTHSELIRSSRNLTTSLLPKSNKASHISLLSPLGPHLLNAPSFPLFLIPPRSLSNGNGIDWTWHLADDGHGGPNIAVISGSNIEDGVGKRIVKSAKL